MKTAIIGTGISGLGAACILNKTDEITVFEKENYIGGHSRTINIKVNGRDYPVDTGFIVFNKRNYPHLTRLFSFLGVKIEKSDMSFGVSIGDGFLEYGSKNMLAQKRNIYRPAYWRMILDIIKFNRRAESYLNTDPDFTLNNMLDALNMGKWFRAYYLQAMGAAIWSCSAETIGEFPAAVFVRFFKNHGLLTINDHPQWYTVTGGSREYIKILTAPFLDQIHLNCGIQTVRREKDGVHLLDSRGREHIFDRVVFACHSDQALSLLQDADTQEGDILGAIKYQENRIIVHDDPYFMPKRRKAWASWIYLSQKGEGKRQQVSLSYWMNNLQNFQTENPVFVTLNPDRRPDPARNYDEHVFSHPVFDAGAVKAQSRMSEIQGRHNCWYCGAYHSYGFHEDGFKAGRDAALRILAA